jgi:hypothetical protein
MLTIFLVMVLAALVLFCAAVVISLFKAAALQTPHPDPDSGDSDGIQSGGN